MKVHPDGTLTIVNNLPFSRIKTFSSYLSLYICHNSDGPGFELWKLDGSQSQVIGKFTRWDQFIFSPAITSIVSVDTVGTELSIAIWSTESGSLLQQHYLPPIPNLEREDYLQHELSEINEDLLVVLVTINLNIPVLLFYELDKLMSGEVTALRHLI